MMFVRLALGSLLALTACGDGRSAPVGAVHAAPLEPSRASAASSCPRASKGEERGRVASETLDELSGLAASRRHPGVLWVHNDSGDHARLFALRATGELIMELRLLGAGAVDFEDVAVGPGPEPGKHYLYLADIGDNLARRKRVYIYRVEEPATLTPGTPQTAKAHQLQVTYQDGPRDAETLLSDPRSGDLYIVGKASLFSEKDPVGVYRIESAALGGAQVEALRVAEVAMGPATAGDIAPDGSAIALRNYKQLRYFRREPQESVADALRRAPCSLPLADTDEQGEALGFAADGKGYYTVSEGKRQPLYFYELKP